MSKLASLAFSLSALHPNGARAASPNQKHADPLGVSPMTKVISFTAAVVLFVPVAAVFLIQASRMIA